MVQAHALAAKTFADELRRADLQSEKCAEIKSKFQICMDSLEELRGSLVTFPNIDVSLLAEACK